MLNKYLNILRFRLNKIVVSNNKDLQGSKFSSVVWPCIGWELIPGISWWDKGRSLFSWWPRLPLPLDLSRLLFDCRGWPLVLIAYSCSCGTEDSRWERLEWDDLWVDPRDSRWCSRSRSRRCSRLVRAASRWGSMGLETCSVFGTEGAPESLLLKNDKNSVNISSTIRILIQSQQSRLWRFTFNL